MASSDPDLRLSRRKISKPIVFSRPVIEVVKIFALVEEKKFDPTFYCPCGFSGHIWRVGALIERQPKLKKQKLADGLRFSLKPHLKVLSVTVRLSMAYYTSV